MSDVVAGLRHAIRRWIKRPAFACTAVLTLATGIGATTAIFSVVDAVLLKPLPWRDPDRLVSVLVARPHWRENPVLAGSWDRGNISWPIFQDLQSKSLVFSDVAAWSRARPTLNGERNELVTGMQISASFLPMLGVYPHLGRFFTTAEDVSPSDSVLVTYETWQRRFGGSPDVLGHRASLDETMYAVVGVLPSGFNFDGSDPPEFLFPWGNTPVRSRTAGNHFMNGLARLKPGIPLEDAVRDSDPHVRGIESPGKKRTRLVRLIDQQQGASRQPLWILLGASSLLLLITCANVAGLLLGDAESRRHEVAVRAALGGSRRQIVQQLSAESAVLTAAAAIAGIVLASWFTPALVAMAPTELPRVADVGIDLRVFGFAVLVSIATALLFGTAPVLALARADPARALREGGRDAGLRRRYAQRFIVAGEVALAVVLLAAASLLGESFFRLTSQPVGFDPANLIVASPRLPRDPGSTAETRLARTDTLVAGLAALPGVVDATATSTAPFSGSYGSNSIQIEGKTFERDPPATDTSSRRPTSARWA